MKTSPKSNHIRTFHIILIFFSFFNDVHFPNNRKIPVAEVRFTNYTVVLPLNRWGLVMRKEGILYAISVGSIFSCL